MRSAIVSLGLIVSSIGLSVQAQDTAADSPTLLLELNRATANDDGGCQVIFRGENGLAEDFADVAWRLAVFDAEGVFQTLLSLPLGALAPTHRRVVQYNLPYACENMSDIVVNDVTECTLAGGGESEACLRALTVVTRTDIAFGL